MSQDLVSFVLRFVREVGEDQQARWRGVIKHVQGDTEEHFTQFSEALAFMQAHVNEVIKATFSETERLNEEMGENNPFLETARLWGEYMPRYTRLMTDIMGEAVAGSQAGGAAMSKQMEQMMAATLRSWGMPTQDEQERAAEAVEKMAGQLAELTAKMDELEARLAKT
ncbi:MAG: hypothetical protein L0332_18210 [Chloroflexi bacterium]|nr:hypothetical protein [Chloroflexota bacterium]MCI0575142.1 hypothetical protein [Chloroflexota bacterium]MCI0646291.1 hypothetical protein [Chloroflexota bacterium]MCI0728636.1 hypothetical protein [Chloroflexota bacterium]